MCKVASRMYRKNPKNSDIRKICCNHPKIWTRLYRRVMLPKDADGIANSVDSVQTAPLRAVWSGSAMFAQAYLSKNLGSLRYAFSLSVSSSLFTKTHIFFTNICNFGGLGIEFSQYICIDIFYIRKYCALWMPLFVKDNSKDLDRQVWTNSADLAQTAPQEAVTHWRGSLIGVYISCHSFFWTHFFYCKIKF